MTKDKRTVLVIDDELLVSELISVTLEDEYNVIEAETGEAGLEICRHSPPDLIILDLHLKGIMTGHETLVVLKNTAATQGIPILIISGKAHPEDISFGEELGAVNYIDKPFHPKDLLARVARFIKDA